MDFSEFEEKIGVLFTDKNLLRQAFTHRSYLNEHPDEELRHNERLEFLGDAVLELVATEDLFARYPDTPEGELTAYRAALVNTASLSDAADKLDLGAYLLLSKGEARGAGKGRNYILANTVEAVIGALYIDQGYEAARRFIEMTLLSNVEDVVASGVWQDAKSRFQEKAQEIASITPAYRVLSESGPDHAKEFVVGVFLADEQVAQGCGRSKQEAEQSAAREALEKKGWG